MPKAKWALILVIFAILSVLFAFQYHSVLTADAQQGEIISQLRLVKIESNTSEPQSYSELNGTAFESNITIENPNDRLISVYEIWPRYFREKDYDGLTSQYLIAEGFYLGNETTLYPSNSTFNIEMQYRSPIELTSPGSTTPYWFVTLRVKCGFSARLLEITGLGSIQTCTDFEEQVGTARVDSDETYPLLFAYLTSIIGTWIIGTDTMLIIELARAKDLKKIKRLETVNFVLLGLFVLCALLLPLVPYPSPSMAYYGPILPGSGGIGVILILIQSAVAFIALLSFTTAIGLSFDRGWSRTLAPLTLAVFALFPFYPIPVGLSHAVPYNGPTGTGNLILQASFFMIIATTFTIILRLRGSELR
jgi:hypothetical protein